MIIISHSLFRSETADNRPYATLSTTVTLPNNTGYEITETIIGSGSGSLRVRFLRGGQLNSASRAYRGVGYIGTPFASWKAIREKYSGLRKGGIMEEVREAHGDQKSRILSEIVQPGPSK